MSWLPPLLSREEVMTPPCYSSLPLPHLFLVKAFSIQIFNNFPLPFQSSIFRRPSLPFFFSSPPISLSLSMSLSLSLSLSLYRVSLYYSLFKAIHTNQTLTSPPPLLLFPQLLLHPPRPPPLHLAP